MTRRTCPACGQQVEGPRETCPRCLALLVDDVDARVACPRCGRMCPAHMQSCPGCMALLRPDPAEVEDALAQALAEGRRLHRPPHRAPFAAGPSSSVLRLSPRGGLVVCGPDGLIEADVVGADHRAVPPLSCRTGPATLFQLERYRPATRALVAFDHQHTPLATFIHAGALLDRVVDVRDETSAPVARLAPSSHRFADGLDLVETGGERLATISSRDIELEDWIDDEWSLATTGSGRSTLQPLAYVALLLAVKVLFGRVDPVRVPERSSWYTDLDDDGR